MDLIPVDSHTDEKVDLENLGHQAYQQSSIYRELFETFNSPAFQCLLDKLSDPNPELAQSSKMFMELYAHIDRSGRTMDFTPYQKLGLLHYLISNNKSRPEVIKLFNQENFPKIFPEIQTVASIEAPVEVKKISSRTKKD